MKQIYLYMQKHGYSLLFLTLIVIFLIIKIPDLLLPCFWDEAWPYSVAIYDLYDHGLSLSPGAISPELYRGHPIFYHFCQVLWMKIFGSSLLVAKTFPLFISVMLLISVYMFCKTLFDKKIGIVAVLFILLQPVFLTQSTFLLPEIFLALLTLLTFYSYVDKKKILYLLACSAMLLTKETGAVFFISIFVWHFIDFIRNKERNFVAFLKSSLFLAIPILPVAAFFVTQKIIYGWFLFPFHVELLDKSNLLDKIFNRFDFVFISKANWFLFALTILSLALYLYRKIKFKKENLISKQFGFFILFLIFATFFVIFCAVNFFSPRYILCILPLVMIAYAYWIITLFNFKPVLSLIPVTIISVMFISININAQNKRSLDHSLSFRNAVDCQKQTVQYLEENNYYDASIFTHFLMRVDLEYKCAGYRSNDVPFTNILNEFDGNAQYCIFSDVEYSNEFDEIKSSYDLELVKRFERNHAYTEIYRVKTSAAK